MLQVSRKTRALTAVLVALVALGVFAASAAALPAKFFGVVPQSALTQEQFNTLKQGGVKTMRIGARLGRRAAERGGAFDWSELRPARRTGREERHRTAAVPDRRPAWAVPTRPCPGPAAPRRPPACRSPAPRPPPGRRSSKPRSPATAPAARSGAKTRWSRTSDQDLADLERAELQVLRRQAEPDRIREAREDLLDGDQVGRPERPGDPRRALREARRRSSPERARRSPTATSPNYFAVVLPRTDVQDEPGDQVELPGRRAASLRGALPPAAGGDRRSPQRPDRERATARRASG